MNRIFFFFVTFDYLLILWLLKFKWLITSRFACFVVVVKFGKVLVFFWWDSFANRLSITMMKILKFQCQKKKIAFVVGVYITLTYLLQIKIKMKITRIKHRQTSTKKNFSNSQNLYSHCSYCDNQTRLWWWNRMFCWT